MLLLLPKGNKMLTTRHLPKGNKMPTTKHLLQLGIMLALFFTNRGLGSLAHEYRFDSSDPYADSVGGSPLASSGTVGTITFDSEGFASFSGVTNNIDGVYLYGEPPISSYNPFVLSIWFRIPTTNQSNYASIFSSNPSNEEGFQINFLNGWLSVNIKASEGAVVNIVPTSDLTINDWHLITIMQDPDATQQGQVWMDDTQYYASTNSIFGALNAFRLGINRNGKKGFKGDITLAKIYNAETWDDTKQDDLFVAGPAAVPEPAALSLILMIGIGGFTYSRIVSARIAID